MKSLLFHFIILSAANADTCKSQTLEILKNKPETFVNCFVVNEKPLTIVAVQVYPLSETEPSGVTLSAYINAERFSPQSKPSQIVTRLGQLAVPLKLNGKEIRGALFTDVDKDGKKDIVLAGVFLPRILQIHIYSWSSEESGFKVKSHSSVNSTDVDYISGAYLPATGFEYPELDLSKHTLAIPYEAFEGDTLRPFYKRYKLVGPLYVEVVK